MSTDDTRWEIDGIEAEGIISGQPTWSVGENVSITFVFDGESIDRRPTESRDYEATYGGATAFTYGGEAPATYGSQTVSCQGGAFQREDVHYEIEDTPFGELQSFTRYSGSATTAMSVDGVPLIRETIPARSDRETFVVRVEPVGRDVEWTTGGWCLVTAATDESTVADVDAWLAMTLEMTVLAPLAEYDTIEELQQDMAPPVFDEDFTN